MGWKSPFSDRLKRLWRTPGYRTRVAFFLLLGAVAGLLAARLEDNPGFWADALKDFSIVFIAVGALQLIWDFLGGDPLSLEIRSVDRRMSLLSDLLDQRLGIDRVWANRRLWQKDEKDGLEMWRRRMCEGRRVDVMSNTFWNNWLKEGQFVSELCDALTRPGRHVRVLVYDPESSVARLREADEEEADPVSSVAGLGAAGDDEEVQASEMKLEIHRTIGRIETLYKEQPVPTSTLELRLTEKYPQLAQIVRVDDLMLVALYLSGRSGGHSPTLQLVGPGTKLFDTYEQQFELMWERATPFPRQPSDGDDDS